MRPSRSDTPTICLICDADGIVRFQTPRPAPNGDDADEHDDDDAAQAHVADDGFSSNGHGGASATAAEVGVPLVKTYWFDHLDCDHREVHQVVRRCASGDRADRLRVWLRIDEHQLIRAELTVTPLTAAAAGEGDERLVLVRADPTPATPAGRRGVGSAAPAERASRPIRTAAPAAADLLDAALPTPLLRLDRASGTVLGANRAFADLLGRPRDACANLPLTELCVPADRRGLAEFVAALRSAAPDGSLLDRSTDVTLPTDDAARDVHARITLMPDPLAPAPAASDAATTPVLLVVRDVSSEAQMVQLMARADQLAGVAVRNSAMLRTLERAFDHAPVGLSLAARGETLRANAAFEAAVAQSPDAAGAIADVAARVRAEHRDVADDRPFGQVRGFWAGDEHSDVVGTLLLPRDAAAWRRVRALATLTDDESRVALGAIDGDAGVPLAPADGESAALSTLVAEASLAIVREAIAEARERATRVVRSVALRDGRAAELTAASAGDDVVLTHLALARPTAAQLDAARDELAALRDHVEVQASALRAARAEVDAVGQAAEARIARSGADRAAHLDAMLTAIGAGSFTWDVTDGRVVADARARELLSLGDGDAAAFTQATLLAAARADERQAYERALFDAMSPDGPGTLDVHAHVGPDAHAVRLIGRVIFESDDADGEPHDPTRLLAVVLDLRDERARSSELDALRAAHATLDAAHSAIRDAHASIERDLAASELRVAELTTERATSLARIGALETSLKSAEAASRTFETNVKSLEANVRTLTRDRASLEADVARRGREGEAIAAELAGIRSRVAEIEGQRAQVEGERDERAGQLAAIDAERTELRATLAEAERARAQADATARLRAAELNALFECVPDAVRVRSDGVTRHNAAAAALFGDALAFGLDDATPGKPSKGPLSLEVVSLDAKVLPAAAAMAGRAEHATMRLRRDRAPRPIVVHSIAAPVRVDGQTVGAVVVDRDQSEQLHVESQLGRSERAAAAIFQNTGVGVAYLDAGGVVLDANAQTSVLLGFSNADLVGRPLGAVAATPADRATLDGQREAVLSGELASCSAEFQLARRDERPYWVQMTVALGAAGAHDDAHDAAGAPTLVVLIQDVDELRRLRDEQVDVARRLAAIESRRRLIAAAAEDGLVLFDANGAFVESNVAARKLLGPADGSATGGRFIVGETNEQITATAFWARVARGRPGASEYRVERDGVPTRHVRVSVTPAGAIVDGVGEADAKLTIVRATDLSSLAAVQEELRQAQGRIVEAHTQMQQRTATLEETFASAVQQLGAAAATAAPSARTLVDDPKLNAEARDASRRVADAIRVHERLVAHFNAAATLGASAPPAPRGARLPVDVHALAEEAITLIDERFGAAGRLRRHLDASRAICDVDAALARHGLWSLLAHAASQSPRSRGATAILRSALSNDARRLELSLTWPSSRANTAEIAIARSLLEAAGGTLRVEAAGDAETTATIAFALASTTSATNAEPARPTVGALLIEDHESTARVLARQLTRLGCEVRHVRDLAEARAALAAKSNVKIDLVVCDLTMPGGDAVAFLGEVTRRRTPAIALRGYEGGPDAEALRGAGVVEQLVKPVDLNALAASIRRLTT